MAPDSQPLDQSTQVFFNEFGRALTSGDVEGIVGMWGLPALVLSDDMVHSVTTADEIRTFFGGAKEQYNAKGITDTKPEILRIQWQTERIAEVEVRWPYIKADKSIAGSETSTYVLRRDDANAWKLHLALMKGVSE